MNRTLFRLLASFLLVANALPAQQPATAVTFQTLLRPGTTLGGYVIPPYATIDRRGVAINSAGETAFVMWAFSNDTYTAILTPTRIVVKEGDIIDGKVIMPIRHDAHLAINARGQVAYAVWYADTPEIAGGFEPSGLGIFLEHHLVATIKYRGMGEQAYFKLTDDSRVIQTPSTVRFANKLVSVVASALISKRQPTFPTNRRGQMIIPAELESGEFRLLLATPDRN